MGSMEVASWRVLLVQEASGMGSRRRTSSIDRSARNGAAAGRIEKARSSRFRGVTKHRRSGRLAQLVTLLPPLSLCSSSSSPPPPPPPPTFTLLCTYISPTVAFQSKTKQSCHITFCIASCPFGGCSADCTDYTLVNCGLLHSTIQCVGQCVDCKGYSSVTHRWVFHWLVLTSREHCKLTVSPAVCNVLSRWAVLGCCWVQRLPS